MLRRIASWVPFAIAFVGSVAFWGAPLATRSRPQVQPTANELAAAAQESPLSLIVDFRDDVSADTLASNAYVEQPVSRFSAVDRLYRVRFDSPDKAHLAFDQLRQDPTVESVDWDLTVALSPDEQASRTVPSAPGCAVPRKSDEGDAQHPKFPDDPCFNYQWHLRQIGLPTAWTRGQGTGAVVAVIDTGVSRVPDLEGTEFVPGYDFVRDREDASDDHGHGTHVAGTIAQSTNNHVGVAGVAFGAKIMPLKVLSAQGSGSMAAIAQAIRWAADHGANVINMSLGGPLPVTTIRSAVKYARDKGVTVIAAAGNDGRGRVSYPAKYTGVFAVAATQFDEQATFYSNWGSEISLAAPGGNVRVDQNGDGLPDGVLQNTVVPGDIRRNDYLLFMGTSMATPHVAGVAALLVGAGVTRPDAVERLLLETARTPKTVGARKDERIDDHYGAGIVDAGAALAKAKSAQMAGPPVLAGTLAIGTILSLRRRRRLGDGRLGAMGLPFGLSLILGAASLALAPGNALMASAALPFLGVGLLWSVPRFRPVVAGLAFGFAGALALAAIAMQADVRFVPDVIERGWLAVNAAIAAVLGLAALRR